MSGSIFGYLQRKKATRLYQQWVDKEGLPPEEIPHEETYETGTTRVQDIDRGLILLPVRFILLGGSLIALLLIMVAILSTILLMQSC